MRLHVIEDEEYFPPLVADLDDGDVVCLDGINLHNLEIGDQIQCFPELETYIYIVVDAEPADISETAELPGFELVEPKYVTLRNVYCGCDH